MSARHALLAVLAVLAPFTSPTAAPSPHDATKYPVVVKVPGMDKVRVVRDVSYAPSAASKMDLYHPDGPARRRPAVVFVNGFGGPLREWEIYKTWARLVAAHGLVGVTYQSALGASADDLRALVERLTSPGAALGVDPSRIALWSCSANVRTALPYMMNGAPPGVRAAVVYYGVGEAPKLRGDLPVFWVLAGRDDPALIEGQRTLFARAVQEGAPWMMVNAPELTHAFDALDEGAASRRTVIETVAFLVQRLGPDEPAPSPSDARRALTHLFGHETQQALEAYREIVAKEPDDAAAWRALANVQLRSKDAAGAAVSFEKALALGGDALQNAVSLYNLACAYALSGKKDEALDRLAQALAAGFGTREQIERDEDLALLRGDPRYLEVLAKARSAGTR